MYCPLITHALISSFWHPFLISSNISSIYNFCRNICHGRWGLYMHMSIFSRSIIESSPNLVLLPSFMYFLFFYWNLNFFFWCITQIRMLPLFWDETTIKLNFKIKSLQICPSIFFVYIYISLYIVVYINTYIGWVIDDLWWSNYSYLQLFITWLPSTGVSLYGLYRIC